MNSKLKARTLAMLLATGLALMGIEAVSQIAYCISTGSWYWVVRKTSARNLVQPHPYFGACLEPNVSVQRKGVTIRHNSFRCRGPEFARPNPRTKIRIATLGGSTTYCSGVSEGETWQDFLNKALGSGYEVINMGTPVGTSIETLIQSALLFSDVQPDFAVFYLGWNDAQVQHVKDLWPDWSDSHGKFMLSFAANGRELRERTATGYLIKRALFRIFFPQMEPHTTLRHLRGDADALTDKIDPRALALYERNLRLIVAICRKQNVEPVFVPQILNYNSLTSDKPYGWIPFVRDRDLKTVMAAYNETMARVAKEENVVFIGDVLAADYGNHFIDNGHFSAKGNEIFAKAIAPRLANARKGFGQN
jgi:lysophospholipase L1-like esterase